MTSGSEKESTISKFKILQKMKLLLKSIALATFTVVASFAQSEECKTNASLGIESAKVKNYAEALPYLTKVRKDCPTYTLATYQYLEKIYDKELDSKKNAPQAEKAAAVNKIIDLLKERQQNFPSKTSNGDLYSTIAQLNHDNGIGTNEAQFNMFEKAYQDKDNFTSPKGLYTYFTLLVGLQKEGKKDIQEVFDLYDDLTEKIEVEENKTASLIGSLTEKEETQALLSREKKKLKYAEAKAKVYGQVKKSLDAKLGKLADCPNLIPLYTGQYDANQNNIVWVKAAAKRMYKKGCTEEPLFLKLVEKQHELQPSAASALYLGKLSEQKGDDFKALDYYNQSAELETNPNAKADVYANIASNFKSKGSYSKARKYYRKALEYKPSFGGAYIQIANMIGKSANNCGKDEFSKLSVYWLAASYARKAARVSPSIASYAKKLEANYMGSAPTKTMIFQKGMQGKTVQIGCWIGESVRVPNL